MEAGARPRRATWGPDGSPEGGQGLRTSTVERPQECGVDGWRQGPRLQAGGPSEQGQAGGGRRAGTERRERPRDVAETEFSSEQGEPSTWDTDTQGRTGKTKSGHGSISAALAVGVTSPVLSPHHERAHSIPIKPQEGRSLFSSTPSQGGKRRQRDGK